jgi:tetratricopeptide (TPR) repeat protein
MSLLLGDKRLRLALGLGILEASLALGLAFIFGDRLLPMILVIGLLTVLQLWALFGPSGRRNAFHRAQAAFMAGDYAGAEGLLAEWLAANPDHLQGRTLLGNTYRQAGKLNESRALLQALADNHPGQAFPLYGLGRSCLAMGDYPAAIQALEGALGAGGQKVMRAELALAYYLDGQAEGAAQEAAKAARLLSLEAHRGLMLNLILLRTKDDPQARPLLEHYQTGLSYWGAEATRFVQTPYGQALQNELHYLYQQGLIPADASPTELITQGTAQ